MSCSDFSLCSRQEGPLSKNQHCHLWRQLACPQGFPNLDPFIPRRCLCCFGAATSRLHSRWSFAAIRAAQQQQQQQQPATLPPPAPGLSLNQAPTSSFNWPIHGVTIRQIHEFWYVEDATKSTPALMHVKGKVLAQPQRRYVSIAKKCVEYVDAYLPGNYFSLTAGQKDDAFRVALSGLCEKLILQGHPASLVGLMSKMISNDYSSIYSNDLKRL